MPPALNKTLAYEDLRDPDVQPMVIALRRWVRGWFWRGRRLAVNAYAKRRLRLRPHKLWEYARGLALTETSGPTRNAATPFNVLDVGGAMTAPAFYLGTLGDEVLTLDVAPGLVDETNELARRARIPVAARVFNLVDEDPSAADLGAPEGFDRVFCFCVIEHIVPPGQTRVAERMARLLKPGGRLVLTFDYGANSFAEAPIPDLAGVEALREVIGLPLFGNDSFDDDGRRYPLSRRRPDRPFTFGSLFFEKPRT